MRPSEEKKGWVPAAAYIYVIAGDDVIAAHRDKRPYSAKTIYIQETSAGSFMLVRLDGTVGEDGLPGAHDHRVFSERPLSIVAAMKLAEKKLGPDGKWGLTSQLHLGPFKHKGYSVNASIASDFPTFVLTTFAAKDRDTALDSHMHDFSKHKTIWEAIAAAPAAFDRVVEAAKCACKEIETPRKRRVRKR